MEQVISYKERHMGLLQDIESLKQEKAALVAEKVCVRFVLDADMNESG